MSLLLALPCLAADFDPAQAGITVQGSAQQLGKPKDFGSAKITVSVPADNSAQDGINPITGEPYSGRYMPVLVNIDSHPRALPHWGVGSADLIYELPIQRDGSTRQLALFMSEYPEIAGPVRSARIPMASLREMWGAPYYFFGYQEGTTSVKKWVQQNSDSGKFTYPYIELMNKKIGQWYRRSSDHSHVAPYNVALLMDKAREEYAVSPDMKPFLFSEEGLTRGESAPAVIVSYKATSPAYLSAYQYREETGLYERLRNGQPYIDALTGEATAYANVIVVRTDVSWANNNPSRPVIRLHGEGVCEIFQNGRYIRGTWVRNCTDTKNLDSRMIFLDENGEELPMKVGKTFIQIVDNEQPVIIVSSEEIAGSVEPEEQRLIIGDGKSASSSSEKKTSSQKKKPKATATPTASPTPTPTPESTATPEPEPEQQPESQPEQTEPEQKPESQPEQTEPEQKPESQPEQTEPEQKPESQPEQTEPEQQPESQPDQAEPAQQPESQPDQTEPAQQPEPQPEQAEPEQQPEPQPEQTEPEQKPEQSAETQAESQGDQSAPSSEEAEAGA